MGESRAASQTVIIEDAPSSGSTLEGCWTNPSAWSEVQRVFTTSKRDTLGDTSQPKSSGVIVSAMGATFTTDATLATSEVEDSDKLQRDEAVYTVGAP
jgi:hypothetical protein